MDNETTPARDGEQPRSSRAGHPNHSQYWEGRAQSADPRPSPAPRTAGETWCRIAVRAMLLAGVIGTAGACAQGDGRAAQAGVLAFGLAGCAVAAGGAALGSKMIDAAVPAVIALRAARAARDYAELRDLYGYVQRTRLVCDLASPPVAELAVAVPLAHEIAVGTAFAHRPGDTDPGRPDAEPSRTGADGNEAAAGWRRIHDQIREFSAAARTRRPPMPPSTRDTWERTAPDDPRAAPAVPQHWSRPGDISSSPASPARPAAGTCPACGSHEVDVGQSSPLAWTPTMRCRDCGTPFAQS